MSTKSSGEIRGMPYKHNINLFCYGGYAIIKQIAGRKVV